MNDSCSSRYGRLAARPPGRFGLAASLADPADAGADTSPPGRLLSNEIDM